MTNTKVYSFLCCRTRSHTLGEESYEAYHVVYILQYAFMCLSETFKRVAHLVSGVRLRDHIVDVVFTMFDENGKGFE